MTIFTEQIEGGSYLARSGRREVVARDRMQAIAMLFKLMVLYGV